MDEDILGMILFFIVVAVPIFGFTLRFALHPVLETLLRLRESSPGGAPGSEERMLEMVEELQRLSAAVERLEVTVATQDQLRDAPVSAGHLSHPPMLPRG